MSETIISITEYGGERSGGWGTEAGFQVLTTEQVITLAIDDEAFCCETWGYFLTEDDAAKFVGEKLLGVAITDTNRSHRRFPTDWDVGHDENDLHLDGGDVMFVDIETSRGILQFVAYNAHNGYYGHEARVSSTQLTHSAVL